MPDDKNTSGFDYERYKKYYDELPKEVVELLINTHPLKQAAFEDETPPAKEESVSDPKPFYTEKEILLEEEEVDFGEFYDKKTLTNSFSLIRIISVAFFSILIFIIGFLAFSNSSLSKKLADANLLIDENKSIRSDNDDLALENLSLQEQIEALQQQIDAYNRPTTGQEDEQTPAEQAPASANQTPVTASASTKPIPGQSYTVARGDNLWKIAQNAYGNGQYYTNIMEANQLTGEDVITAGMRLTIPPLP